MWLILLHVNDLLPNIHNFVDNRTSELVLFRLDITYFIIRGCRPTWTSIGWSTKMRCKQIVVRSIRDYSFRKHFLQEI